MSPRDEWILRLQIGIVEFQKIGSWYMAEILIELLNEELSK